MKFKTDLLRLRAMPSAILLGQLTPTRRLIGAVACELGGTRFLGLSISDPYLSFASPLADFTDRGQLCELLSEHDAEGIIIGLPLLPVGKPTTDSAALFQSCVDALEVINRPPIESELPISIFEERLTYGAAMQCFEQDPLWDQTGMEADANDISPGVQSAIMLQQFLDENCGGWQNTFG
jgi:RNase H-fold protein (predicted Holliday junction resolvase)